MYGCIEIVKNITIATSFTSKGPPCRANPIINFRQIKTVDFHPGRSDKNSATENISDTNNWLCWSADFNGPYASEDDWDADSDSNMELDNGCENVETTEHRHTSVAPSVTGLIQPNKLWNEQAVKVLMIVNTMEMRRHKEIKKN